jgi:hypothetical protein
MTGVNGRLEDALLKAFPAFISVPAAIASRYRCQKERKIQQDPKKTKRIQRLASPNGLPCLSRSRPV